MTPIRRPLSPRALLTLGLGFSFFIGTLSALLPAASYAGTTSVPRLALHLLSVTSKNACGRSGATPACEQIASAGGLYPDTYYAYLLVTNGDAAEGVAGLECGLSYNGAPHQGVDIFSWVNCADLHFPQPGWPAAGTGNLITWDPVGRCQLQEPGGPGTGVVATAGYFYLAAYSADVLQITTRPTQVSVAAIADCRGVETILEGGVEHHEPSLLGSAVFSAGGASPGYNPCADSPEPIPCQINGPSTLDEGASGNYGAVGAPAGANFLWSVSGSATIVGSYTDPTVTVQAGSHGYFNLDVVINHAGVLARCSGEFGVVVPRTTCLVSGPAEVMEGQVDVAYYAYAAGPADALLWEITGDGTLTSDPTLQMVRVDAGNVGAYELTLHDTPSGQPAIVCQQTVTITPLACGIYGGNPAPAHVMDYPYLAGPELAGATYDWQISGDATIDGSHQGRQLLVNTNGPGTFDLSVTISRGARTVQCSETVAVEDRSSTTGPDANTKLLIHLTPVSARDTCGPTAGPRCTSAVTAGGLFPALYYAYLIAGDADATAGLSALECGIDYDGTAHSGVDIFSWQLCATNEARHPGPNGPWPAPGSGDSIIWDTDSGCQRSEPGGAGTGVVATAGYFYMAAYSPDQLRVTPSTDGQALVLDCAAQQYLIGGAGFPPGAPSHLGYASFSAGGTNPGFNPCGGTTPVRVTTWSAIKGLYGVPAKPRKP